MITLYKIDNKKLIGTNNPNLLTDNIYIIIDRSKKRPKIWIWSGNKSDKLDKYQGGVIATKLKSGLKLYGASIEVVEEGSEPENFPALSKQHVIKQKEGEIDLDAISDFIPAEKPIKMILARQTALEPAETSIDMEPEPIETPVEVESESMEIPVEIGKKSDLITPHALKTLLEDVSSTLADLQTKIQNYLKGL